MFVCQFLGNIRAVTYFLLYLTVIDNCNFFKSLHKSNAMATKLNFMNFFNYFLQIFFILSSSYLDLRLFCMWVCYLIFIFFLIYLDHSFIMIFSSQTNNSYFLTLNNISQLFDSLQCLILWSLFYLFIKVLCYLSRMKIYHMQQRMQVNIT